MISSNKLFVTRFKSIANEYQRVPTTSTTSNPLIIFDDNTRRRTPLNRVILVYCVCFSILIVLTYHIVRYNNEQSNFGTNPIMKSLIVTSNNENHKNNILVDVMTNELKFNVLADYTSIEVFFDEYSTILSPNMWSKKYEDDPNYHVIKEAISNMKHHSKLRIDPHFETGFNISYFPQDLAKIYKFPNVELITGTPSVGIIALGGVIDVQEVKKYWFTHCGIPYKNHPTIKIISTDGSSTAGFNVENTIDTEILGCILASSSVTIVLYHAQNTLPGVYKAYVSAIFDTTYSPKVISTSWGLAEEHYGQKIVQIFDNLFKIAVSKGINIVSASGDSSSSCGIVDSGVHVDFPSSSPNVISTGGTTLIADTNSYQILKETAWSFNMTFNQGGGGGYSVYFDRPYFQNGIHSSTKRAIPDVSLNANPLTGVNILFNSYLLQYGGTSIVSPLFSAFLILNNVNTFVLPTLYKNIDSFNKITEGTNGYYKIDPNDLSGYNVVCGLGSFKGDILSAKLQKA